MIHRSGIWKCNDGKKKFLPTLYPLYRGSFQTTLGDLSCLGSIGFNRDSAKNKVPRHINNDHLCTFQG